MSKYTKEAARIFHETKAPYRNLRVELVEYPGHLALRVYSNNVAEYTIDQKVGLATWLYRLRDRMRETGAPVEIEGVQGGPNR